MVCVHSLATPLIATTLITDIGIEFSWSDWLRPSVLIFNLWSYASAEPRLVQSFARTLLVHSLELVHQVQGWFSGVELKMSRRQGGPSGTGGRREHI